VPALLCGLALAACGSTPPAPLEPSATLAAYSARRLDSLAPGLPPVSSGWDRAEWLAAALRLNPRLAQQRAAVEEVAAGERTAAEHAR